MDVEPDRTPRDGATGDEVRTSLEHDIPSGLSVFEALWDTYLSTYISDCGSRILSAGTEVFPASCRITLNPRGFGNIL